MSAVAPDFARELRDHTRREVRRVAALWLWLSGLQGAACGATPNQLQRVREMICRDDICGISDARAWRLTIDILMGRVDNEIAVRKACRAMFARVLFETSYDSLAEHLCRPRLTV